MRETGENARLFFCVPFAYADGSTMCRAKGTLAEVKASEERIEATEAYAEFGGISHERAAQLALEIVNC